MRRIVMAAAIGVVVSLSACGNGAPTPSGAAAGPAVGKAATTGLGTASSSVQGTADLVFNPTTSSVKTGGVVQWTNSGSVPHNVTFDDHQDLSSGTLQQNDTWQVKFTVAGTYSYHCTFHPGMNGTITVGG